MFQKSRRNRARSDPSESLHSPSTACSTPSSLSLLAMIAVAGLADRAGDGRLTPSFTCTFPVIRYSSRMGRCASCMALRKPSRRSWWGERLRRPASIPMRLCPSPIKCSAANCPAATLSVHTLLIAVDGGKRSMNMTGRTTSCCELVRSRIDAARQDHAIDTAGNERGEMPLLDGAIFV